MPRCNNNAVAHTKNDTKRYGDVYRCNKKVLYDLPEVFEDFLRAYTDLLVKVYEDSGVCLSRAQTKTTMNAFGGTFTYISHLSRFSKDLSETENRFLCSLPNSLETEKRFRSVQQRKLKTLSAVLCRPRRKLKTVSVCTMTETENRFRHTRLD